MLRIFFHTLVRKVYKNKLIFFINIIGLSVSIACSLVVFAFVEFEFDVDSFHAENDRIFLITQKRNENGHIRTYGKVPSDLGPALIEQYAHVEKAVRIENRNVVVLADGMEPLYEIATFADEKYLEVFNFPLEGGGAWRINQPSDVIISHEFSVKYFGKDNAINKHLKISIGSAHFVATVVGVAKEFPKKKSFEFELLVSRKQLDLIEKKTTNAWQSYSDATFVKIAPTQDISLITDQINHFVKIVNEANHEVSIESFQLQPLSTLALETYKIRGDISRGYGDPSGRIAMIGIGILLLILSTLNYVNNATALGMNRLREVGVRKVLGSSRRLLVLQFIIENLLIIFLALLIGLLLAYSFLLPGFDKLFAIGLQFEFLNPSFVIFLVAILFLTTLFSGVYPAIYVSKFQPTEILQRNKTLRSGSSFSRVMLSFQYLLSLVYIVAGILFVVNEDYQRNISKGYDDSDLIVVCPVDAKSYKFFVDKIAAYPEIVAHSGSNQQIGYSEYKIPFYLNDKKWEALTFNVESTYFNTLGLAISEGTLPKLGFTSNSKQIIVNETFVKTFDIKKKEETRLVINDTSYFIQAIVKDFHHSSFQAQIEPVIFFVSDSDNYYFLTIDTQNKNKTRAYLKQIWKESSPEVPVNLFDQSDAIEQYFTLVSGHSKVMIFAAFIAVFISSMGLFSLVYLDLSAKLKNYSIMKVMGAGTVDLVKQVSKGYFWYILTAIIVGIPLSFFIARILFSILYKYNVQVSFLYPTVSVILLTLITASTMVIVVARLTKGNPIKYLRDE
jgi:putative ABC transport system permease protein